MLVNLQKKEKEQKRPKMKTSGCETRIKGVREARLFWYSTVNSPKKTRINYSLLYRRDLQFSASIGGPVDMAGCVLPVCTDGMVASVTHESDMSGTSVSIMCVSGCIRSNRNMIVLGAEYNFLINLWI